MKTKFRLPILALLVLAVVGGGAWWYAYRPASDNALILYGNVDFRQASVPFNGNERIAEVLVEEGERVKKGQVLARLDTSRILPQLAQAEAEMESQKAAVERLLNGTRKEEIAQSQANLESAKADAVNATAQYERLKVLGTIGADSQQNIDQAKAAANVAAAKVAVARNALSLAVIGPRPEDIAQAKAQLRGHESQLALLRQQVADAELRAPFDAVVQSRLMEPGEMASPAKPVFSLATIGTKWVRAYISEPDLSHVRNGSRARIRIDSMPDHPLEGWVGFISSVAEFTPKTVQTEDLRTSLVYEVRVFVKDADNLLRLGMPATVTILPDGEGAADVPPG
ncbi:MAG: efflux RND transporter periplasmic adaptor subunit [Candidatus Accumulibacter sp.]|jgi:HlyD family secretion protein|nr:efflux RND transporter periplasmic adaptor subunit [Accumulibacter sp.]